MFGSFRRSLLLATVAAVVVALAANGSTVSAARAKAPKRMAYYTDLDAGRVYGVQIKFKKKPKLKLKKTYTGVANPWGVALDPDEKFLLVTDHVLNTVTKLSLPGGAVLATVAVGQAPTDVGILPSGDHAFIVNSGSNTVTVYDTRTDQVLDTLAMKNGALRLEVNDRGTSVYVANVNADSVTKINALAALGLDDDPGSPVLQHVSRSGDCDLSGGIDSVRVPGNLPFNWIMWTCGTGATAGARAGASAISGAADSSSHDGEEDSSDDCYSESESSDDCSSAGPDRRSTGTVRLDPAMRVPFGFSVPGAPTDMVAVGLARAPAFLNGGFCSSNSLVVSYQDTSASAESLAGSVSYLWHFGETGVELADGFPFGPLFGGAGDRVYANPICGPNCSARKIASKTKELAINGAANIIDGAMLPVPFGPDC